MNRKISTAPEVTSAFWINAMTARRQPPAVVVVIRATYRRRQRFGLTWAIPDQPRPDHLTEAGRLLAQEVRTAWLACQASDQLGRRDWLDTSPVDGMLVCSSAQVTRDIVAIVLRHLPEAEVRGADLLGGAPA